MIPGITSIRIKVVVESHLSWLRLALYLKLSSLRGFVGIPGGVPYTLKARYNVTVPGRLVPSLFLKSWKYHTRLYQTRLLFR
jgi:hypothetical protein